MLSLIRQRIASRRHLHYRYAPPGLPVIKVVVTDTMPSGMMQTTPCRCKSKTCTCGPTEVAPTHDSSISFAGTVTIVAPVKALILPDEGTIKAKTVEACPGYKCGCLNGLLRRPYSRNPCKDCGQAVVPAGTTFHDGHHHKNVMTNSGDLTMVAEKERQPIKDRVTCEPLFCAGQHEADGFDRKIAVRYLASRMVFRASSNAKGVSRGIAGGTQLHSPSSYGPNMPASTANVTGKAPEPDSLRKRKTSSAKHDRPWFHASDVEDMVQEAWLTYQTGLVCGDWKFSKVGDVTKDTRNACRNVMSYITRERYRERKAINVLSFKLRQRDVTERNKRSLTWDSEVEQLVDLIREEGTNDLAAIGLRLGITKMGVCKRLKRLRERNGVQ